jgi:hypothetical protein
MLGNPAFFEAADIDHHAKTLSPKAGWRGVWSTPAFLLTYHI